MKHLFLRLDSIFKPVLLEIDNNVEILRLQDSKSIDESIEMS